MCQLSKGVDSTLIACHTYIVPRAIPSPLHFFIMPRNKQFRCNIVYNDGNPAEQVIIEANNPPQARDFAEARYPGGRCTAANQLNG